MPSLSSGMPSLSSGSSEMSMLYNQHYMNSVIAFAVLSSIFAVVQIGITIYALWPEGQIVQSSDYTASLIIYAIGYTFFLASIILITIGYDNRFIYSSLVCWVIVLCVWASSLASNMNNERKMHILNMANIPFVIFGFLFNLLKFPYLVV